MRLLSALLVAILVVSSVEALPLSNDESFEGVHGNLNEVVLLDEQPDGAMQASTVAAAERRKASLEEEAVVASADSLRDMQAASQAKAAVSAAEARAQEAEDDLKRQELNAKKADCVEVAKEAELHQLAASATKRAATAQQKARDEKQQEVIQEGDSHS